MLIDGTPRSKNQYGGAKTRSMQAVCCHLWLTSYLEFQETYGHIRTAKPMFTRSSCLLVLSTMSPEVVTSWHHILAATDLQGLC